MVGAVGRKCETPLRSVGVLKINCLLSCCSIRRRCVRVCAISAAVCRWKFRLWTNRCLLGIARLASTLASRRLASSLVNFVPHWIRPMCSRFYSRHLCKVHYHEHSVMNSSKSGSLKFLWFRTSCVFTSWSSERKCGECLEAARPCGRSLVERWHRLTAIVLHQYNWPIILVAIGRWTKRKAIFRMIIHHRNPNWWKQLAIF